MQLVEQHIIKLNNKYYKEIDKLSFLSKNLYNKTNYIVRQEFINSSKLKALGQVDHANYLNYYAVNKIMISNKDIDYCSLPRKVSNQTMMILDKNWKSFFKSIKDYINKPDKYQSKPKLPNYKHKTNGRNILIYELGSISKTYLRNNIIKLSGTEIKIKTNIDVTKLNQVRIVPRIGYYVIEVVYTKNEMELKQDNGRYCSIDLGINNLATISSNVIKPVIINGKPLKSINQYYNKKLSKLKSHINDNGKSKSTKRIKRLHLKRNNKVNDYLHKSSKIIMNHLVSNNINTLVIGKNNNWKQDINIGTESNQKFVMIPHTKLINLISYKCKLVGINVIISEESFTSKASFLNNDLIPTYNKNDKTNYIFSGYRIYRGLYKLKGEKTVINADLNGSLNILRKVIGNFNYDPIQVCSTPMIININTNNH
jgi:putative transposase